MENKKFDRFDIIVVGGGHAGIEAAYISSKMGANTLLITIEKNKIGTMPCNPSIGGLGKSHIVYEVSALGGLMPKLCTQTYLQARMLNTRKGPAVHGLRLQIDKYAYNKLACKILSNIKNLTIYEGVTTKILHENNTATGVECTKSTGKNKFIAGAVIITSGTYLNGMIHIGDQKRPGGNDDSPAVTGLSESIEDILNTKLGRLKTGTPPRLLRDSIDFSIIKKQPSSNLSYLFEFDSINVKEKQTCFITKTNQKTHTIIKNNIKKSALFGGSITGTGPRYCPSIEDKVMRFYDKTSHHVFIEPEGGQNREVYPGGISTSLPLDIQKKYINSIRGLENAVITKPGYAIEYDFLQPNNLKQTLESKKIKNLFFAGQINGTTGYEEAAGQGVVAGINGVLNIRKEEPFILKRTNSYIGVMLDDITTLGVDEPYRMFTSRAERRLILRQDNVFSRLSHFAKKFNTITEEQYKKILEEEAFIKNTLNKISNNNKLLKIFHDINFMENYKNRISKYTPESFILNKIYNKTVSERALLSVHAEIKYRGYIEKEKKEVIKSEKFSSLKIPNNFNYKNIPGMTKELTEKLILYKPKNIAQAQLIPGMTPAGISLIIFLIKKDKQKHIDI